MSVTSGHSQLFDALKTLRQQWHTSRSRWKDGVARQFEEEFWNALEASTKTTLSAMDRLDQILRRIKRDCDREETQFDINET